MGKAIIITINYKQIDYTIRCITSILTSTFNDFEILLIDNGPTKDNHLKLKGLLPNDQRIHLHLSKENIGYVKGINFALQKADEYDPEYIMILNNDTYVDENSINELVKACQAYQNKAIVTGKVFDYDNKKKIQTLGFSFINNNTLTFHSIGSGEEDDGIKYEEIEERDLIDDQFWLFPYILYKEIGGYSEYFFWAYEQANFALRAKAIGYKLIYTPKANLWHRVHGALKSSEYNAAYCYWDTQSELIFKFLHTKRTYFIIVYLKSCFKIVRAFIKAIIFFIAGKEAIFKYALAKFYGFLYFNKWLLIRNTNSGKNPFL
jgi:GT2 family glycosyltransferase